MDETGGLHEPPVAGVRTVDGAVVVSLVGELDLYNAHVVRERLAAATNDGGERLLSGLLGARSEPVPFADGQLRLGDDQRILLFGFGEGFVPSWTWTVVG